MAHRLLIRNGKASMMYVGETPWHGLGTRLQDPATAAEALRAAQLDWDVSKVLLPPPGRLGQRNSCLTHAITRPADPGSTRDPVLGWVKEDYIPLQNREAFKFFDPIVGHNAAVFHTAGAIGQGEKIWILAKLPIPMEILPHDLVDKYLLLSNSHDGQGGVEIRLTPIRVVCANTLSLSLIMSPGFFFDHSPNLSWQLEQTAHNMSLIHQEFDRVEETFRQMTRVLMTPEKVQDYLATIFPNPTDPRDIQGRFVAQHMRQRAAHFFTTGMGNQVPGVRGTLWAAYNGVTQMIDHHNLNKGTHLHLDHIWFGQGARIKTLAYQSACLGEWPRFLETQPRLQHLHGRDRQKDDADRSYEGVWARMAAPGKPRSQSDLVA